MWRVLPLTWILNLFQDLKIRFNFNSNLTSAMSNFSKSHYLASYVSHHNAMAYDTIAIAIAIAVVLVIPPLPMPPLLVKNHEDEGAARRCRI
jgi:hypothetical protein